MNDIETRLQTFAPDLRPPTFGSADVSYVVDDTAVGRILFARNEAGALVASRYVADDEAVDTVLDRLARAVSPRVLRMPAALDDVRRQVDEFLDGRRHQFDLTTDLVLATPFQRACRARCAGTASRGRGRS